MIGLAQKLVACDDVVYLDTETTGVGGSDEIVQLTIIDNGGRVLFSSLVKPAQAAIEADAQAVHGITPAMAAEAPTLRDLFSDIVDVLLGRIVVAYNATFDERMLRQSCRNNGIDPATLPRVQWVDIMKPYARFWSARGRWQSLVNACAQQSVKLRENHDATNDCQMLRDLVHSLSRSRNRVVEIIR